MKKIVLYCLLFGFSIAAKSQQKTIVISNPLTIQRTEEVVEIPWSRILEIYPALDTSSFKVIAVNTKAELPCQLEYKGTGRVQNLLVQLSIPAKGSVAIKLVQGKHKPVAQKTYCRYVPERKDDFAWENDRIAFRMYGRALESSPKEMAYGVDVWVKRTGRMIINERYQRGEYHIDHGDGLDYYHVGLTLGAGGVAPYLHDTIWFPKNYRRWKVLDNGPLRCSFQLGYDEWAAAGKKIKATKIISLDAGSQLNKVEVRYETEGEQPLPLAAGIIKRKEAGEMLLNEKKGILAYWEPQHGADGTTGVACLLPTPVTQMMVNQEHLLALTKTDPTGSFIYYNGAAWDKAGKIAGAREWFHYLDQFQDCLKNPLRISVK
jgi:hypothetical protein